MGKRSKAIGEVVAVNLSPEKGTAKYDVGQVQIDYNGVVGDSHAGPGHRQVSLLSTTDITAFAQKQNLKEELSAGTFGENITFNNFAGTRIALLDRLQLNKVVLEVTQIGKKCHGNGCAIFREVGKCVMAEEGFFARVLTPGEIAITTQVEQQPYLYKILVITLSDRAAQGIYPDTAGERAGALLTEFFSASFWRWQIQTILLPDEADQLRNCLAEAVREGVDLILTVGGTGLGERDIAPETVGEFCTKLMPRVMANICFQYGATNPLALLSRSIAGTVNKTQIYTLPGSVRAVNEYLPEIFKVLEHAIFMVHGIPRH